MSTTTPGSAARRCPALPAGELDGARFDWSEPLTPAALRSRMATQSAYAILEPAERDRILDAGTALITAEATRLGTRTVPVHYASWCARWRPHPPVA